MFKRLKAGDTVGIITPAGAINLGDRRIPILESRLKDLGLKVKYGKSVGTLYGYLGGTDEARRNDIMDMFLDKEVKVILAMLGGYGTSRIVDKLDYEVIKNNPKLLMGFSDITVLLNSIYKLTGIPTAHGPVGIYLGRENYDEFSLADFNQFLLENQKGRILKNPKDDAKTLIAGEASGVLVGGNLSLINNLIGTPYEIDFTEKIVFIEEVNEKPYAVDRFFSALRLSGALKKAKGFVLGYFTNCGEKDGATWEATDLIKQYFQDLNVPIIYNFASGHDLPFITLPIGVKVKLDATGKTLTILEEIYED